MKKSIGDGCEEFFGLGGFGQYRFACEVAGGGDQRPAEAVQEQFVQGTVGQQCAKFSKTRCKRMRQSAIAAERDKHDRSFTAKQAAPRFGVDRAMQTQLVQAIAAGAGEHHRQRLGRTALSIAEAVNGGILGGVAIQVISADASHGDDAADAQGFKGTRQRRFVAVDML